MYAGVRAPRPSDMPDVMRRLFLAALGLGFAGASLGCAETTQDAPAVPAVVAPAVVDWDLETRKDPPPAACATGDDGGAPAPDGDAGASATGAPAGSGESVVAAIRAHVRPCYDELLARAPGAHGRLAVQIWTRRDGSVCGVRPTLRLGLAPSLAACVERMVHDARFEGVPSPLAVPLTYAMKRPNGAIWGHPARIDVEGCTSKLAAPTEATLSYASDANGHVGDLAVDPWKGDQPALECVANAVRTAPHGPSTQFVLRVRMRP